jgi:hypothetical protein
MTSALHVNPAIASAENRWPGPSLFEGFFAAVLRRRAVDVC